MREDEQIAVFKQRDSLKDERVKLMSRDLEPMLAVVRDEWLTTAAL